MGKRNRLKVLRAALGDNGITQMDLALKTGLTINRYWRIENGYEQPTDAEQARLAKALKAQIADLGFVSSSSQAVA